jgi:hypothetical protein
MRIPTATVIAVMGLAAAIAAQPSFTAAWPSKVSITDLEVDSSAPGLLPSGVYVLDLHVAGTRLIGRLHQASRDYESIPFSVRGCDGVKSPNWARRATARGLPPAPGQLDRRVELRIADTNTRGCTIAGTFTADNDPQPGGRPNPGIPDQAAAAMPPPDLTIRAAKHMPHNPKQIQLEIYNGGAGPSKPTQVKVFFHKNGKVSTTQGAVPMLAAKASVWVIVGTPMPLNAADGITARVDDPNVVPETDELNNGLKFK